MLFSPEVMVSETMIVFVYYVLFAPHMSHAYCSGSGTEKERMRVRLSKSSTGIESQGWNGPRGYLASRAPTAYSSSVPQTPLHYFFRKMTKQSIPSARMRHYGGSS